MLKLVLRNFKKQYVRGIIMDRRRLVVVVLLVVLFSNMQGIYSTHDSTSHLDIAGISQSELLDPTIKIHLPGSSFDDEEKLSWSPNNLSQFRQIQFSIMLDSTITLNSIRMINITGVLTSEGNYYDQFANSNSDFTMYEHNNANIVVFNYTYPVSVWAGNYLLNVTVLFADGSELNLDHQGLNFLAYDYMIDTNQVSEYSTICACETKIISTTLQSTGEDGAGIFYEISITDANNEYLLVTWDDEEIEDKNGILDSGDSVELNISITITDEDRINPNGFAVKMKFLIYYTDDSDNRVNLKNGNEYYTLQMLPEYFVPEIVITIPEFDAAINSKGERSSITNPNGLVSDVFSLNNDFLFLDLSINNRGYNTSTIAIKDEASNYTYRIITSDYNLSLEDFNSNLFSVESMSPLNITLLVNGLQHDKQGELNLSVSLSKYIPTYVKLKISSKPNISADIFSYNLDVQSEISPPLNLSGELGLNLSTYDDYLFFRNDWLLSCSLDTVVQLEVLVDNTNCLSNSIPINISNISMGDPKLELSISLQENEILTNFTITFTLEHNFQASSLNLFGTLPLNLSYSNEDIDDSGNNQNNTNGNQNNDNQINGDNSSSNNNTTGTPVDDCADIQCDACPLGMVIDPNGGCCACMEEPETNVDPDDQNDGQSEQQNDDSTKTATEESSMPTYLIIGLVIAALIAAVVIIRARKSSSTQQTVSNKITAELPMPALPLPGLPIPSEPVVMQQWTDDNGYSWRQMSDRTIMWWNGSDWIPYGKN